MRRWSDMATKLTCSGTNPTQCHFNVNSTWNCPSNPGFWSESSAINRLCPRHGHAIQNFVEFFLPVSYKLYISCLAAFRSECLKIPIITCAMSVGERKCRGRCGAGIRLSESVRDRQWPATDTSGSSVRMQWHNVLASLLCWWQVISQFGNSVATTIRSLWTTSCTFPNW